MQKIEVAGRRRTWRIEFMTEKDTDYDIRIWWETVWEKPDGSVFTVVKEPNPIVRKFSDLIRTEPAVPKLANDITILADRWVSEAESTALPGS